ncbi:protein BIG GRAIN 1-like A [Lycium barbarum]|uniref:protein BIG GRAIN 1-like A n=1 Tax=Lycium barbarum TaxID=112863 RepID=UPI00293EC274|nr:protein BIG GRAIN 1-like A [Lycium barbarum]
MLFSFPLFVKPHYNRPICHSIDQAGKEKKSRNLNSNSLHIGSSCYGLNIRPKPIITSISTNQEKFHNHQYPKDFNFYDSSLAKGKPKDDEDGFKKTKSRASKIYRDLKKVKQPISPGGRLSSFLYSLFTNGKKTKILTNDEEKKLKSANASTCSSSSSFSRSCLSKKNITTCGHKNLDKDQQNVEAVKSINRNYIHEDHQLKIHKSLQVLFQEYEDNDDEDEGASCASSDLFELDIFSSIGSVNGIACL